MVEKTKCGSCKQVYEIIWDDTDVDDWRDDFEDDDDYNEESENEDPVFCPFCGNHCDFAE